MRRVLRERARLELEWVVRAMRLAVGIPAEEIAGKMVCKCGRGFAAYLIS